MARSNGVLQGMPVRGLGVREAHNVAFYEGRCRRNGPFKWSSAGPACQRARIPRRTEQSRWELESTFMKDVAVEMARSNGVLQGMPVRGLGVCDAQNVAFYEGRCGRNAR